MTPKALMNRPSARTCRHQAPQRQQSTTQPTFLGIARRRSSRLQSRRLETCCDNQSFSEQQLTDPKIFKPVRVTSSTILPTAHPTETSPTYLREQLQESSLLVTTPTSLPLKRRYDEFIDNTITRSSKRPRLTKENLKALEKMGGQSKKSGGNRTNSNQSGSKSLSSSSSNKTVSTTDSRFPVLADRNGILWGTKAIPPTDLEFLRDQANRSRSTVSPTESEYKDYSHNVDFAENEGAVAAEASNLLRKYRPASTTGYRRAINLPLKDFPKEVGFNNGLSPAQPDLIEGLEMPKFDPFPVAEQLSSAVPYLTRNAITLPHFAGEWKGPGKDLNLAQVQAAYDGASMVYARSEAKSLLGHRDTIGSAKVFTFTSDGTSINTYANFSLETKQGQFQYHQYPITSTIIRSSYEDFKKGRKQLRNLQDYAKETSEKLRDELNEKWLPRRQDLCAEDEVEDDSDNENGSENDDENGPSNQLLEECRTAFIKARNEGEYGVSIDIPILDASLASLPQPPNQSGEFDSLASATPSTSSSQQPRTRLSSTRPGMKLRRSSKSDKALKSPKTSPNIERTNREWKTSSGRECRSRWRNNEWEYDNNW